MERIGKQMADSQWIIEGRHFRSYDEYLAAKRDKQLIDSITGSLSLDKPRNIERLYKELNSGKYQFESIIGREFDDKIYDLYENLKKQTEEKKENCRKPKLILIKNSSREKKVREADKKISLQDFDKKMQQEILLELRKKERKRRMVKRICVSMCVMCLGYFVYYYQTVVKSEMEFAELAAMKEAKSFVFNTNYASGQEITIHKTQVSEMERPDILPEYENLYNKNKKLIGWIKIDDTIIDYPVMQTIDNEYYLNHNFEHKEDRNGCIFMDYQCDILTGCDNTILYGHHMQSGKMFGSLNKYSSEEYYRQHPVIQFDTIYEKGTYEIMYVFRSKVYSEEEITFKYYQFINAGSENEYNSYLNEMAAMSLYDTGVTAAYGDRLLTLSTCDYQEKKGRFVVVAKRVN